MSGGKVPFAEKVNLRSLHQEYQTRFDWELEEMVASISFLEVIFLNNELLFSDEDAAHVPSLHHLFCNTFIALELSLNRLWENKPDMRTTISIPNLATLFSEQKYFGCHGLAEGRAERLVFDELKQAPILKALRVARTELYAHSVQIGKSSDREKLESKGWQAYDPTNGETLAFGEKTMLLLYSLACSLNWVKSDNWMTLEQMRADSRASHCALLRNLFPNIIIP